MTINQYLATIGAKGGKARTRNTTKAQRSKAARLAARARWNKLKEK